MPQILSPNTTAFTTAGAGDQTIVAADANGRAMRIWAIEFTVDGATNVIFKNGSTALSGAEILTASGSSMSKRYDGMAHYYISPGNAFIINSSAAQNLQGTVWWTRV